MHITGKRPLVGSCAALLVGFSLTMASLQAATIVSGVSATASNTYPSGGLASPTFLVDNSGLSVPDDLSATHTILGSGPSGNGVSPNSWHSNNGIVDNEFVTFDLHGTYNLETIYIWQMNQNLSPTTLGRGVKQFDLLVSSDGTNFTEISSNLILAQATGAPVSAQSFAINQTGVSFVRIGIDSSWNGTTNDYVGLSEVKFTTVPEPGSFMALLGGSGVLLGLRQRRRA